MSSIVESETNETISSDQIPSEEQVNTDESPTTSRTAGQTAIGAKLVKKLETLGESFDQRTSFSNTSAFPSLAASNSKSNPATDNTAAASNESDSRRNVTKAASMD